MKEWAASIIGVAFAVAVIVFFGTGKIPLEVFGPIATAAILWFFRDIVNMAITLFNKVENIGRQR